MNGNGKVKPEFPQKKKRKKLNGHILFEIIQI